MADDESQKANEGEPVIRDNRKIDPETGEVRSPTGSVPEPVEGADDHDGMIAAEDADIETPSTAEAPEGAAEISAADRALLADAEVDLVADMRDSMLRAQAELVNFRTRVERDRTANREIVIAEVIRSLLPAMDDLSRADKHGDLEGSPLAIVAQKLRAGFDKYGLREVGVVGEPFDPNLHEALVQLPNSEVTINTVADVIAPGYALGERLLRAAKVAVHTPAE